MRRTGHDPSRRRTGGATDPIAGRIAGRMAVLTTTAMVTTLGLAGTAVAAPEDEAEATAQLVEADLLGIDLADAVRVDAGSPSDPGPHAAPLEVGLLGDAVPLDLGTISIPLVGDGPDEGMLTFGPDAGAGLLNGYAAAPDGDHATAASGAVTDDGALAVSPGDDRADTDYARLDLTALLGQLGVDGLTDQVVDEISLALGALGTTASATHGGGFDSDYVVAGAELQVSSPLVGDLTSRLSGAVGAVSDEVNQHLGTGGTLESALAELALPPLDPDPLATVDLGTPEVRGEVDLAGATDGLLDGALTSDDGLVTIDLSTGVVGVDLARLHRDGLNGLPANTELLTEDHLARVTGAVTALLDDLLVEVRSAVLDALLDTNLTLTVATTVDVLEPVLSTDLDLTVTGSLGGFLGLTEEDAVVGTTGDLELVGIDLGDLLDSAGPLVTELTTAVRDELEPLLDEGSDPVAATIDPVFGSLLAGLAPVLDALPQLATVTLNHQDRPGVLGEESFTVRAVTVELLPGADGVQLPLASSSVRASGTPEAGPRPEEPRDPGPGDGDQPDEGPVPGPQAGPPTGPGVLPNTGAPEHVGLIALAALAALTAGAGALWFGRHRPPA